MNESLYVPNPELVLSVEPGTYPVEMSICRHPLTDVRMCTARLKIKEAESYEQFPAYQREGGDFIEWENPNTGNRLVMIASGFGDGFYQCFWGFDADGEICELIVPMVNPDLIDKLG